METQIVIDLETATPPYEQVQSQITSLMAIGELTPGTRLPTVRSLAADLGVAAGTVARAYKELEAAGLVVTNRRQGTVVSALASWTRQVHAAEDAGAAEVMAAVENLINAGTRAGLDGKTLITLLQGRLRRRDQ